MNWKFDCGQLVKSVAAQLIQQASLSSSLLSKGGIQFFHGHIGHADYKPQPQIVIIKKLIIYYDVYKAT